MIRLNAGCKVNLGLYITGRRDDGYHELDSIFYPLSTPCDTLEITEQGVDGLTVHCTAPQVDVTRNTLTRAYATFRQACGAAPALSIRLHKGIPCGAGLGGGSSDAAALLRWLNARSSSPLPQHELVRVAVSVGADVPFFLYNTPCRVQGIGERITPLHASYARWLLLLVCPALHVDTAWAFGQYDAAGRQKKARHAQNVLTMSESRYNGIFLHDAGTTGDATAVTAVLHNDLEAVVFDRFPVLADIKASLYKAGAYAAGMSGSGASMLALFCRQQMAIAQSSADSLRAQGHTVFLLPMDHAGM